jgi:hypothetical protein
VLNQSSYAAELAHVPHLQIVTNEIAERNSSEVALWLPQLPADSHGPEGRSILSCILNLLFK